MDVGVGNLKHVFRLFQCFSDSSDHAEPYTIHKYTDMRVHIPPPPTQTLTQAGQAETEGDRDSKEMEIKIERERQQRDKESCFTCASNSMAFIFFEGTKLNQKRKTKTGKEVRGMKQIFKTKKREQELRMWLSW